MYEIYDIYVISNKNNEEIVPSTKNQVQCVQPAEACLPRRIGVDHNFFAPAYRRQVFARIKKRIRLAKTQSRQGIRKSIQEDHYFFAPAYSRQVLAPCLWKAGFA
jgi:hypothetical protein